MKQVKLEDIVKYIKDNDLSRGETLYLIYLYNSSKKIKNNYEKKANLDLLINKFSKLDNLLFNARDTKITSKRLKKETIIFEKINKMLYENDFHEITNILYEIEFMLFELGVENNVENAHELLINKLSNSYKMEENYIENTNKLKKVEENNVVFKK